MTKQPTEADLAAAKRILGPRCVGEAEGCTPHWPLADCPLHGDDPLVPERVQMMTTLINAMNQMQAAGAKPTAAIVHPDVADQMESYLKMLDAQLISVSGLNDLLAK